MFYQRITPHFIFLHVHLWFLTCNNASVFVQPWFFTSLVSDGFCVCVCVRASRATGEGGMNREEAPGKSPEDMYIQQKVRVLLMLKKMGSNVSTPLYNCCHLVAESQRVLEHFWPPTSSCETCSLFSGGSKSLLRPTSWWTASGEQQTCMHLNDNGHFQKQVYYVNPSSSLSR